MALFVTVVLARTVDVYRYALVGGIFEFIWFPSLLILFVLPVPVFIYWHKEKYSISSPHLYSIMLLIATFFLLFWVT